MKHHVYTKLFINYVMKNVQIKALTATIKQIVAHVFNAMLWRTKDSLNQPNIYWIPPLLRCCSKCWRYNGNHGIKKSLPSGAYILREDDFLYVLAEKTLHDLLFHEKSERQVLQVRGDIDTEHLWKDL